MKTINRLSAAPCATIILHNEDVTIKTFLSAKTEVFDVAYKHRETLWAMGWSDIEFGLKHKNKPGQFKIVRTYNYGELPKSPNYISWDQFRRLIEFRNFIINNYESEIKDALYNALIDKSYLAK